MKVKEGSVAQHEKLWGTNRMFKSGDKKKLFDMSYPKYIADEPKQCIGSSCKLGTDSSVK